MRQDIDMRTILNEAAKSGLLLGLFTGVFIYAAMLVGMINSGSFGVKLMITVVNALLWMLKFVGCLWLLRFFMISSPWQIRRLRHDRHSGSECLRHCFPPSSWPASGLSISH